MKKYVLCLSAILAFVMIHGRVAAQGNAIRPISNPVFFDSPGVGTLVHPIFMHQSMPSKVNTTLGEVSLGGDFQLYAVQLEVALNDRLSIIALKDGWVDFNPDNDGAGAFSAESGLADLAAGLKWVVLDDSDNDLLISVKTLVELPTGDDEVWQGNGDGTIAPAVSALKRIDQVQLAGTVGFILAVDDEDSSLFYDSWHASYALTEKVFPLVELNHFRVIDEGDGGARFDDHVGGAVPSVARFEGGDLVNLGAANADDNADIITLALGCRVRVSDSLDLGAAYEFPLTDEEDGLMDNRITIDFVWTP